MKIAWVTPCLQRSAIARESRAITLALAGRGHDITLIGSEWEKPEETALHPTALPRLHWSDMPRESLCSDFDLVVANFGDNHDYHGGALALLDAAPCLGIFHDFYLHNLFRGWLHAHSHGVDVAARELQLTYGDGIKSLFAGRGLDDPDLAELSARAPMTEWVARRCAGALAHADFYLPRLEASCAGPLDVANLPVASRGVRPLPPRSRRDLVVLTVGVMNPNKCADRVIQAIAGSPILRSRVRYRLVGPIEASERRRLETLSRDLDFPGLSIAGAVDEAQLNTELTAADLICCLRRPVLEGASGSAIEGLLSGRPTIVADAGFYAGLPDEFVTKVPGDVPIACLQRALEQLASDEPARRRLGKAARTWAASTFRIDAYVDVLERLMPATMSMTPVLNAGAALGRELVALGLAVDDPAVGRIGALLDAMVNLAA